MTCSQTCFPCVQETYTPPRIQGDKNKREKEFIYEILYSPYYIIFVCNQTRKINFPTTLRRQLTMMLSIRKSKVSIAIRITRSPRRAGNNSKKKRLRTTLDARVKTDTITLLVYTLYKDDHEHSPDAQEDGTEGGHS